MTFEDNDIFTDLPEDDDITQTIKLFEEYGYEVLNYIFEQVDRVVIFHIFILTIDEEFSDEEYNDLTRIIFDEIKPSYFNEIKVYPSNLISMNVSD